MFRRWRMAAARPVNSGPEIRAGAPGFSIAGRTASLTFWQQDVRERDVAQAARLAETEQRARAEANF